MAFNNRNNLNPQSAPWGREVEQKIEGTERGLSSLRALTENNNKATNATLGAISRQQDSIIATQEGLEAAQDTLEDQQDSIIATQAGLIQAQQRISEANVVFPRTSTFTKASGGAANGQVAEFSTAFAKPAWANFAIVQVITSAVTGTFVPDGSATEEPEVSAHVFASSTPFEGPIDFNTWRVAWYMSPYDSGGSVQSFAVDVSGSPFLIIRQRVHYLATASATVSAVQAFSILWV